MIDACNETQKFTHLHFSVEWILLGQIAYLAPHINGLVENTIAVHCCGTTCGRDKAGDDFHQGTFSGAIGSQQSYYFARLNGETYVVESVLVAIYFSYVFNFKHSSIMIKSILSIKC